MNERELDAFSAACGANGPLLLEIRDRDGAIGPPRAFSQPSLVVGRSPQADLTLDDESISRCHCYLQLIGGRLYVLDLEGRTVTRLCGEVRPMGWVRPGEAIGVGAYELRFQGGGAGPDEPDEPPCPLMSRWMGMDPLPGVTMEIVCQGLKPYLCRLSRVLTLVGNTPLCKVRLIDPHVSQLHCALLQTAAGVWMIDLLSREGTLLNGTPRRVSWVDDGDLIRIGLFTIRFRYDFPPNPPTPSSHGHSGRPSDLPASRSPSVIEAGQPLFETLTPIGPSPPLPAFDDPRTQAALRPFLEHVVLSQQQMSEQFHQAVMMMARMFGSMHLDRMMLVRGELEEIRKLTTELQALREELKRNEAPPTSRMPGPGPRSARRSEPPPLPREAPARAGEAGRAVQPWTDRKGPAGGSEPAPGESRSSPPPDRQARSDPSEIQAKIHELVARYERERETRWGRIVRFLGGR